MLESLNDEQVKLLKVFRDKWINRFNSLEFDADSSIDLIKFMYNISGLDEPIVVILDSPMACEIGANIINSKEVRNQVWNQVWEQVRNESDMIYYHLYTYGNCTDYGWVSFYDFFSNLGILKHEQFNKYRDMLFKSNMFLSIQLDGICFVCKPPIFIERDVHGKLHCEEKSAIVFADGYEQHYLHGIYFEKEIFNKFMVEKDYKPEDILKIRNTEQKAALIDTIGYDKLLDSLHARKIDTYKTNSKYADAPLEYALYDFDFEGRTYRLVQVQDHTPPYKKYYHLVDINSNTRDCLGAIASMWGETKETFINVMES